MIKPVYCDTDCLSSFIDVNQIDLLKLEFSKLIISSVVKEEFDQLPSNHHISRGLNKMIQEGFIEIYDMDVTSPEYELYEKFLDEDEDVGEGELSVIVLCIVKEGILASNNFRDVCEYVKRYNLNHITTSRILVKCYEDRHIDLNKGNEIWKDMIDKRIRLPERTFEIYLGKKDPMCYGA
ncbi:MAG: nucleic acid-binding protein [Methanobrevibacter thaueri]|nr:nucleic acid-binding protein [Methanobrevibacter thaueri]